MIVRISNFGKIIRHWIAIFCLIFLSLYAIIGLFDNKASNPWSVISKAAAAQTPQCTIDEAKMKQLKQSASGFFKNFRFAEKPYYAGNLTFQNAEGKDISLNSMKGKTLLVNLWAIWCVPCRTEMPQLALLQKDMANDDFQVVAINIDHNPNEKVAAFMKSVNADSLYLYRDKAMASFNEVARNSLALGLPVTLLLDKDNCLIGSYNGSAPWDSEESKTLINAAIASQN